MAKPRGQLLISVRIHKASWLRLGRIANILLTRANAGTKLPVLLTITKISCFDVAVNRLARELKLNV